MRRTISWILGFLGILLVSALIVPFFLNLNNYKPFILEKAREALGREVSIDGDLSLSLLPSPQLTIHRLRIGNIPGGSSQDFFKVERVRTSVAFLPLFRKHLKLTSVELDHPDIFLEKLQDGKTNWTFTLVPSSQGSSSNFEVAIDKITLTDGHLIYQESGRKTDVQAINIHTTLEPIHQASTLTATLKAFDQDFKLDGKFKPILEKQDVTFKVQAGKITSRVQGQLLLSSPTFKGSLETEVDSQVVKNLLPQNLPVSFLSGILRLKGNVMADAEAVCCKRRN
jgi:uncharacterized protein involved in outer membrane biogenesis